MQKVTLKVQLKDPSKRESEDNWNVVKGQTVMMFNRIWEETANKDATRDLNLQIHAKNLKIIKIGLAKRYRKRDKNNKITETCHQRLGDLKYKWDSDNFQKFSEKFSGDIEEPSEVTNKQNKDAFDKWPSVQEFDADLSWYFKHERGKGLLNINHLVFLDPGTIFPENVDLIIDYEVNESFDSGLIYRETFDPSGKGWYLATAHRYFETHYWLPCIDTLRQKNKWRITLITDKNYEVAWSGYCEKAIEIEDTGEIGYSYRVDYYTAACKIGFFIGSKFYEDEGKYFSNTRKLEDSRSLCGDNGGVINDIKTNIEFILDKNIPYEQIDLVFVPNLFFGENNQRRVIWYAGMCLLDERLISNETIIDERFEIHFHLAYAIASSFFGCYLQEESYMDFWVIEGIAQYLANRHTQIKWGILLYKYKTMKKIEYLTERVTQGLEIYPLCSEHTPHPSYVQYHDHYFVKSGIIMHILENKIKEHFDKLLKILFQETVKQKFTLNTKNFMRKFKKVCGFSPKMLNNWLYKTGAVELKIRQKWMKKSNSVEFEIEQQNWILNYLSRCKEINKKQENKILTKHNLYSNNYLHRNGTIFIH